MKKSLLSSAAALIALSGMAAPQIQKAGTLDARANGNQFARQENLSIGSLMQNQASGMLKAPARINVPEGDPIMEAPAGTVQTYTRDSWGFYLDFIYITFGQQTGLLTQVVDGDDGNVYIYNPFSGWATNSYLKCERDGEKIVAKLPQPIYTETYEGETTQYYACMFDQQVDEEGAVSYIPNDESEVTFVEKDGLLTLDLGYDSTPGDDGYPPYPTKIFGMCDAEGTWTIAGDAYQLYTPFNEKLVEVPEGLVSEQWALVADGDGHFVNLGFDGNDVYLQNLDAENLPGVWIKGSVEDDKITFPSGQFMGDYYGTCLYFYGSNYNSDEDWTLSEGTVMNYDAYNKVITCVNENECMLVNAATDRIYWFTYYSNPVMKVQADDVKLTPNYPIFTTYSDYFDTYGYNYLKFSVPTLNVDEEVISRDNYYFRLFLDDEPFEFYADEYPGLEDGTTEVSVNFANGKNISGMGSSVIMYLYSSGFSTLSVQLVNKVDGVDYVSPTSILDVETLKWSVDFSTGVKAVESLADVKSVEYYNLSGVRVANPESGIYVRKATMTDGSVVVSKVVKR